MDTLNNDLERICDINRKSKMLEVSKTMMHYEIMSLVTKIKEHVDNCGEALLEEMSRLEAQKKAKLHRAELSLSKEILEIWTSSGNRRPQNPNPSLCNVDRLDEFTEEGFKFSANERLLSITKADLGEIISEDNAVRNISDAVPQSGLEDDKIRENKFIVKDSRNIKPEPSVIHGEETSTETCARKGKDVVEEHHLPKNSLPPTIKSGFCVGSRVVARWSEDQVWYRADVLEVNHSGYLVRFVDYGNEDFVQADYVIDGNKVLPENKFYTLDEYVLKEYNAKHKLGKSEVAVEEMCGKRIEEEINGYFQNKQNAKDNEERGVDLLHLPKNLLLVEQLKVDFNKDLSRKVRELNLNGERNAELLKMAEKNVTANNSFTTKTTTQELQPLPQSRGIFTKDISHMSNGDKKDELVVSLLSIGDVCLVKKEGTWYQAKIHKQVRDRTMVVQYLHDNTFDLAQPGKNLVRSREDVPPGEAVHVVVAQSSNPCPRAQLELEDNIEGSWCESLKCCVCKAAKKRCLRLVCDGSVVCWTCAVRSFTQHQGCWRCHKSKVSTLEHTEKDDDLRRAVELYLNREYLKAKLLLSRYLETTAKSKGNSEDLQSPWYTVGDHVIVRWSEDDRWYNATVREVLIGAARVVFEDYGNVDVVQRRNILRDSSYIPEGDSCDINVIIPY